MTAYEHTCSILSCLQDLKPNIPQYGVRAAWAALANEGLIKREMHTAHPARARRMAEA